ncbi:ABC transporter permease [Pseudoclavibacter terrae]|uniref:ABC transporter permease n=1 Tax=Pseudoclavibacter terrae TaxID=1530195 RepID=UPI00233152C6|nr:ABC transporter permease [Pseudoclavibacter terrae]
MTAITDNTERTSSTQDAGDPARRPTLRSVVHQVQIWLLPALLVVEFVVFSLLSPYFLTVQNLSNVAVNAADLALIAAGLTLVILMGGIDVSTGFAVGMVSWVVASLMTIGQPPVVVLVAALGCGLLVGLLNGALTARLAIPSIVATLGTSALFQTGLFALWNSRDLFSAPVLPFLSGAARLGELPVLVMLVLGVYAVLHLMLTRTAFGRSIYAIGSNVEAAKLSGINVRRVRVAGSAILGLLIGVAACTYLARVGVVQASSGGELTMLAIASVVVGGTSILGGEGSVLRTLGGVVFIVALDNGIVLAGVPSLWNGLIVGIVILIAVSINGCAVILNGRKQKGI